MSDQPQRREPPRAHAVEDTPAIDPPGPLPSSVDTATWSSSSAAKQAAPFTPQPGHVLAGRYTVLEQLGQGGMGRVLAAYDARLDRRVALKLLRYRAPEGGTGPELRLVREAQAMARLSHPHVVAVYDAGTLEDGSVFIAMEYVEGQTLRKWREARPRAWREVLAAYLDAGKGLAAAHAAGLVHRDFKPDNVLVGGDGRVRVTDFGLARAGNAPAAADEDLRSEPETSASDVPLTGALTRPGALMGTRDYMAPELLEGGLADVRSDLYAFCVALYEALFGQPPYDSSTMAGLLRAQRAGPPTPPARAEVPAWVTRAVLRGLRTSPDERPATMEAALAELRHDPEARRRKRLRNSALAGLVVTLAGLAAWGWMDQREQVPACGRVDAGLAGTWDDSVRERVRRSLTDTGLPYASDTAARVEAALDDYAGRWVAMGREVCEAGQGPAPVSQGLVALRAACLERRRSRLRATAEVLAHGADRELLDRAVQATRELPPLEDCADVQALAAAVPPPSDPTLREKVRGLQEEVDRTEALYDAGRYKDGLARGEPLLKQVAATGHAPLHAQLLLLMVRLRDGAGDYKGAEQTAQQALAIGARGRDLVLMSQALGEQAFIIGKRQGRLAEAALLEPTVEALAEASGDDVTRARALDRLGALSMKRGRHEEARDRHERALALRQKALGPQHPAVAESLTQLGIVSWWMGRNEQAQGLFERALALRRQVLGPEHPDVIRSLVNLGGVQREQGHFTEALATYQNVLALQQKVLGPEHPLVATTLGNLGVVLVDLGRTSEALAPSERAVALREKLLGPNHPDLASALNNRAGVLVEAGRYEEGRVLAVRALSIWEKALGPDHPLVASALSSQGSALAKLKQYPEAHALLDRARAITEKALGPEHPDLSESLLGLGQLELERGRPAEALAPLRRALKLAPLATRARVQLLLAEALWETQASERRTAVELATEARTYWQRLGHAPGLSEASHWLASHAGP